MSKKRRVSQFSIAYNPYLVECKFKKNGKKLMSDRSKIGGKSKSRLQMLLSKSPNWEGLAEEIRRICNDLEIELHFRGRKVDFDDLKYCIDNYDGDARFHLIFEETRNDADMMRELDVFFDEVKKKGIPQLKEKNEQGKDIFQVYEKAKNGIFEVSVIATMSSGKSTLINSLLHTELLPSENKACTATVARILDNDEMDGYEAACYASDGKTVVHQRAKVDSERLKEYNSDENVTYIDIEGSIPAISSDKIRLCLRDTPGPNNSRDENHGRITDKIIRSENAVVLYVMNATQFGITDDAGLLKTISSEMKRTGKQSRDRFLFVINKCDALDEEKGETIEKMLREVAEYLMGFGITDPILIPTSARLALLVRKDQNGEKLTRAERRELSGVDDFVESPLLHFEEYATLTPTVREKLRKKVSEYHQDEETWDKEALIHTGVPAVEETINEYIEKYAYPMKIQDAVRDVIRILDGLDMKNKFDQMLTEDEGKLEQVQRQIEDAERKFQDGRQIYGEYKKKIQDFRLEAFDIEKEEYRVELEIQKISREYDNKVRVDKLEADRLVDEFQSKLECYQKECESRLNREIDEEIFQKCSVMLDDYREMVQSVLGDIEIEGYDFSKIPSFQKIQISNVNEIKKRNETDRMRDETRWKDNPEREGFVGFFKFWEPKEISYTVQVKDGVDVNIRNVVVDILSVFTESIKTNVRQMAGQANTQIEDYKKVFKERITSLEQEVGGVLLQLRKDTSELKAIQKRVEENRELAAWIEKKDQEIRSLLEF